MYAQEQGAERWLRTNMGRLRRGSQSFKGAHWCAVRLDWSSEEQTLDRWTLTLIARGCIPV